jgi:hypothetical protein
MGCGRPLGPPHDVIAARERDTTAMRGVVIAEGLEDPTVINGLRVVRTQISPDGQPIDYEGGKGRWHLYWLDADDATVDLIQQQTKRGRYAHFWADDRLIVVFNDARFEVSRADRSTWLPAIEHGVRQGIPEQELDFLTG